MSPPFAEIERRLAELERSNRRLRRLCALVVASTSALLALAAGAPQQPTARQADGARDKIVAEAVHLVDRNGALRVLISARAGISLFDEHRRPRAVLSVDASGPGLLLYGETSKAGGSLTVNRDGPALALRDNSGNTRALLASLDQGPALLLSDETERERVALVQGGGGATIRLLDGAGRTLWSQPR